MYPLSCPPLSYSLVPIHWAFSHPSDKKEPTSEIITVPMSQRSMEGKRDFTDDTAHSVPSLPAEESQLSQPRDLVRPPIDYSSFGAFACSVWARWESLWTKRFTFSFIAGQVVSLCITVTNVTTTELVGRNWTLSTTQTWFLWVSSFPLGSRH